MNKNNVINEIVMNFEFVAIYINIKKFTVECCFSNLEYNPEQRGH